MSEPDRFTARVVVVQSREQIRRLLPRLGGKSVEERRLSAAGVARQRNERQIELPPFDPLDRSVGLGLGEFLSDRRVRYTYRRSYGI